MKTHVHEYHDRPNAKTLLLYRSSNQLREITNVVEGLEHVDIVPSGDLELVTSTMVIRVASQVLWTASPVFNAMLGPGSTYSEAQKLRLAALEPGTRAVLAVDDDPIALRTVLQVLHHKHIYSDFEFKHLVRITEVADKYQIAHVIKPSMEDWIKTYNMKILEPGYEDALTIAWVFGMNDVFEKMTENLGSHAVFDQDGQLRDSSGRMIQFSDCLPEIVLGEVYISVQKQKLIHIRLIRETS